MNNNYMPEVAKLLGVELNEEFKLNTKPEIACKLTEFGLTFTKGTDNTIGMEDYWLKILLNGGITIKRPPWKPAENQYYYFVNESGKVQKFAWKNNWIDKLSYKVGNCYRTKEEAEANINKWVVFYTSDRVLEV